MRRFRAARSWLAVSACIQERMQSDVQARLSAWHTRITQPMVRIWYTREDTAGRVNTLERPTNARGITGAS